MENPPQKRIKTQLTEGGGEGEDRISALPDCLAHEILSRLDSTKQAVQTGTLSKRWQHVWPSVHCLSFQDFDFIRDKQLPDFYLAVDKTLDQCQSNNIIKFKVFATYDERFESHVDNWIHFVTSRNVEKLTLNFNIEYYVDAGFVLKADSFFVNSHFTHLELVGCLFRLMKPITWNRLKHLSISSVKVEHDLIANILSGSPLLETLRLNFCDGYTYLDITSKSVKRLVIDGYDAQEKNVAVEINAPYISSLTIEGDLYLWKILLRDVSSLVKADLDYHMYEHNANRASKKHQDEMFNRFIVNLHHVKELKIGIACYEVFTRLEVKGFVFPSNLKGVDVTSHYYSVCHSRALDHCYDNESSDGDSSDNDISDGGSIESGDSEELVLEELID